MKRKREGRGERGEGRGERGEGRGERGEGTGYSGSVSIEAPSQTQIKKTAKMSQNASPKNVCLRCCMLCVHTIFA